MGFKKNELKSWLSERTIKKIEGGGAIHQTKTLPCKNTDPETAEKARYKLKSVEIKKSARRDKKELGDELAEEAETAAQKNDLKTLCN